MDYPGLIWNSTAGVQYLARSSYRSTDTKWDWVGSSQGRMLTRHWGQHSTLLWDVVRCWAAQAHVILEQYSSLAHKTWECINVCLSLPENKEKNKVLSTGEQRSLGTDVYSMLIQRNLIEMKQCWFNQCAQWECPCSPSVAWRPSCLEMLWVNILFLQP
jgi:hypothetical protein